MQDRNCARAMKYPYIAVCLSLLMGASCSRNSALQHTPVQSDNSESGVDGTISIDARVSAGSRFILYCNDVYLPQMLPVKPGEWKTYEFSVPLALKSLRFDPTEVAGADVEIRSIRFDYSGQPRRWMPLSDLPEMDPISLKDDA